MENKCRLCLKESPEIVEILTEECIVINKLASCLSHRISITKDLPNKICSPCISKVDEIYTFHTDISNNELILQKLLRSKQEDVTKDIDNNEIYQDNESDAIEDSGKKEMTLEVNLKLNLLESIDTKNHNYKNLESIDNNKKTHENINHDNILKENNSNLDVTFDTKFMCLTCFEIFPKQLDLLKHYRTTELDKYNESNTNIKEETEFIKYKQCKLDDGTLSFKCEKCDKTYKHKRFIERHIKSHTERRPFLCKLCGKTYKTASIIVAHGKMHAGHLYMCSYNCGYNSVHKHVVKDHEKRHRKEYKYKCDTCGKGFQVRPLFEQHQNIHRGIKPFSCDLCGTTFHLHKYLMTHRSNVHPQTSSRKPWVCKQCSLPCDSKNSLNIHLKEKHGIVVKVSILCDICGKVFRDTQQLKYHKRAVHLNIKPYSCSVCKKSFTKKFTLKVHEQIHVGKLFLCDICDKKYSRKCTLERHLKRFHT